jgi:hypothetical protein
MLVKVTEKFYRLDNVFSDELLDKILSVYNRDQSAWIKQYDGKAVDNALRLQFNPNISTEDTLIYDDLVECIHNELQPVIKLAESVTGQALYQNNPQIWHDHEGYINTIHAGDVSPNHFVNVQVYLNNGNENMGTYCYDRSEAGVNAWHTVPFRKNCGYMMLYPTRTPHGMKHRVVGNRLSVYQGFRSTEQPVEIW